MILSTKYFFKDYKNNQDNNHWSFCVKNKVPFVCIIKSGSKYWKIEFDVASITLNERFVKIDYSNHIMPLYELYCQYSNLPKERISYSGGTRNAVFTVVKSDALGIAEKLFDLLLLLSKLDQELFDDKPVYVDKDGYNSEGFKEQSLVEYITKLTDDELLTEFLIMKQNNPFMLKTLVVYSKQLERRNIKYK